MRHCKDGKICNPVGQPVTQPMVNEESVSTVNSNIDSLCVCAHAHAEVHTNVRMCT